MKAEYLLETNNKEKHEKMLQLEYGNDSRQIIFQGANIHFREVVGPEKGIVILVDHPKYPLKTGPFLVTF